MYERPTPMSNSEDVGEFHHKFGLPSTDHDGVGPRYLPTQDLKFRMKFLLEETAEFIEGAGFSMVVEPDGTVLIGQTEDYQDHAQMFDALIDLVYVALGTAHLLGYPWQEGWRLVQRANMAKVRAKPDGSNSKRGSALDVVKPEGWKAPDIDALLQSYGWDTNPNEDGK